MKTLFFVCLVVGSVYSATAQFYTGYYVSDPQVHSFHHFKIHQDRDASGKLKGDLHIKAFNKDTYLWKQPATYVENQDLYDELIDKYAHGEEIISVHMLRFMWDGNEWEYIMLGYIAPDKHRHFIVSEEVFEDESETVLREFNRFDWVKGHHLVVADN